MFVLTIMGSKILHDLPCDSSFGCRMCWSTLEARLIGRSFVSMSSTTLTPGQRPSSLMFSWYAHPPTILSRHAFV